MASQSDLHGNGSKPIKFERVLYKTNSFPDNYTDDSFLDMMKQNLHLTVYDYWTSVRKSACVAQHLSCVCLFITAYVYMSVGRLCPKLLFLLSGLLTALCFLTMVVSCSICESSHTRPQFLVSLRIRDILRTVVLFLGTSALLSPVFMTLTDTISTDTIYFMTILCLLANVLFHDYSMDVNTKPEPLSLNAALFASVCLASRLHTLWHTFSTVVLSVQLYALLPVFLRFLHTRYRRLHALLTPLLGSIIFLALCPVSISAAYIFALTQLFVTFACPALFIYLQPYKENIYGPWDEATIKE